jgi:hypothetical protein
MNFGFSLLTEFPLYKVEIANHLNFIHEVENHKRQAKFDFGLTIFSFWSYSWKDAKK